MNGDGSIWSKIVGFFRTFLSEPLTFYTILISFSISVFIILDAAYPAIVRGMPRVGLSWLATLYPEFATPDDRDFSEGFVEWFGVFYGFILPLILIRAWEQFDRADREFDREADVIKVLYGDVMLLRNEDFLALKINMIRELSGYVQHVLKNYQDEHSDPNLEKTGNSILQKIRKNYSDLIYQGGGKRAQRLEPVTTELLERLNEIIDIRGDRMSIFSQRLFESFRVVALTTSVIWIVPFYFLDYQSGLLGSLLKLAVTFLIIFILSIIDDLDEPFNGNWKIDLSGWKSLETDMRDSLSELEKENRQDKRYGKGDTLDHLISFFVKFLRS